MENLSLNGRGRPFDQESEITAAELQYGQVLADSALSSGAYYDHLQTQDIIRRRHFRNRYPSPRSPFNVIGGLIALANQDGSVTKAQKKLSEKIVETVRLLETLEH